MTPEQKYYLNFTKDVCKLSLIEDSDESWWATFQAIREVSYQDPVEILARQLFECVNKEKDAVPFEHVAGYWKEIAAAALAIIKGVV